jgi:hypothetical protein
MEISTFDQFVSWNGLGNITITTGLSISIGYIPITLNTELIIDGKNNTLEINDLSWGGLFLINGIAKITIKNLTILFKNETYISDNCGSIIGDCSNSGSSYLLSIQQCNVVGNLYKITGLNSGGIVGINTIANIVNCYTNGMIMGQNSGGIAGANFTGNIMGCLTTGRITGNCSGGITGLNTNTNMVSNSISFSYTTGNIGTRENNNYTNANRGGICGGGSTGGIIHNCYTIGTIYDNAGGIIGGGIIGEDKVPKCAIINCYIFGEIDNSSGKNTGAIGTINCEKVQMGFIYSLNASGIGAGYKQFVSRGTFLSQGHLGVGNSTQWTILPATLFNSFLSTHYKDPYGSKTEWMNIWCDSKGTTDPKETANPKMLTEPPILSYFYASPWNHRTYNDISMVGLQPNPPVPDPNPPVPDPNPPIPDPNPPVPDPNPPVPDPNPPVPDPPPPIPVPEITTQNLGDFTGGTDGTRTTFLRGNPFNLEGGYYLVGRGKNGMYYYYLKSPENISKLTTAVFSSDSLQNITREAIIVYPKRVKNDIYTIGGTFYPLNNSNSASIGNLTLNSNGIVNILATTTTPTNFTLKAVNAVGNSGKIIYPGIWYNLYSVAGVLSSYFLENTNLTDDASIIVNYASLDIMFIPVNTSTNPLTVWKNSACNSTNTTVNLGLQWFNSWVLEDSNSPNGCQGLSYLSDSSNNCFFSTNLMCTNKYLYSVGESTTPCKTYLGICTAENDVSPACVYNPNSGPTSSENPMICMTGPIPDDGGDSTETWEEWAKKYWYYILIVGIVILILIIAIIYYTFFSGSKEDPGTEMKENV